MLSKKNSIIVIVFSIRSREISLTLATVHGPTIMGEFSGRSFLLEFFFLTRTYSEKKILLPPTHNTLH
jgi:hypothetical protein